MRYRIEEVGTDGEPIAPDDVAKKFVKACGTVVRDNIPITVREWNKPKHGGVTYVGDVAKKGFSKRSCIISPCRCQR